MIERVYKQTEQEDLAIRIYQPNDGGSSRPGMIFFYGSAFRIGNLDQFRPHSEHLARHGVVAACADYRVKDRHGTTPLEAILDGRSALRWFRTHAGDFGFDADRIVVGGGSSGGMISLCTQLAEGVDDPADDVSISTAADAMVLFNPGCDASLRPERFASHEEALSVSPIHRIHADSPPSILCYGTEDGMIDQGKRFVTASGALDVPSTLYTADGQDHGFFNRSPWLESGMSWMHDFLHQQGFLDQPSDVKLDPSAVMVEDVLQSVDG